MDYKLLGQRIRAARLMAGLSQEQLAEMVGLTSQHISHTEVASTKISLLVLVKIANALHTSADKLLYDSVQDSKAHLPADVQTVFDDCDPDVQNPAVKRFEQPFEKRIFDFQTT